MKNLIIFLLVVAAVYYAATSSRFQANLGLGPGAGGAPPVVSDPVYTVVRFRAEVHDRSFDMVALAKAIDQADCQHMSSDLENRMQRHQDQDGRPVWQLVSSDCKASLDSRSEKLFDNKPTFVNYVSAAPGASNEREERLIFWGVTAQEGELVCSEIPRLQDGWKGTVTCIHAIPSQ